MERNKEGQTNGGEKGKNKHMGVKNREKKIKKDKEGGKSGLKPGKREGYDGGERK